MERTSDWSKDWRAVLSCLIASVGALQFGYDQSYFSGILVMDEFVQSYGTYDEATGTMVLSASKVSLITSIIHVGEFVGCLTAYWISQRSGLRGGLLIACVIVVIGITLQVAGVHTGLMISGRLVLGYAVGLISCFVPLYIADCSPTKIRGAMVTMYQFNIGIGLLLGVCVDYATAHRADTGSFRIPISVQYILPIFLASGLLLFCPESPRWLATMNRIDDCEKSLKRLKGPHAYIQEDLERINQGLQEDSASQEWSSWSGIVKSPSERRKAFLGWSLQALQQGSGINFITAYGVYFFTVIGIKNPFIIQVALYCTGIPALFVSQLGIEKLGRRPMLILSGAFMAAALIAMAGIGLDPNPTYSMGQGIVALVFIYMISFSLGWGPTVWVACSEISTGRNRTKLMTISTCSNWSFNWLVTFTFPYLFSEDAANLKTKVGFIFGSLMVVAVVWVFFLLPETAQMSLEDINDLFEAHTPARQFSLAISGSGRRNEQWTAKSVEVEHAA